MKPVTYFFHLNIAGLILRMISTTRNKSEQEEN